MARPRTFDQEDAIKGATEIFWRQGFKATNLPDLLKSMHMTRGSFYLAFGTKQKVYALALDYYDRHVLDQVVSRLNACDCVLAWDCLAPLFQSAQGEKRGCFICNAMVELGPENPDVAQITSRMAQRLRDAIMGVLSKRKDQLKMGSASECADLVLQLYFGHQALGRARDPQNGWEEILKKLLGERSQPSEDVTPT